MIRLSIAILGIMLLSGCTITGEPRSENVVFDGNGYTVENSNLRDSIAVGEISDFPGTSNFTYSGRLAPNFSNKSFEEVLKASLENASLHGEGYTLDAKLIDSGDWSDWFYSPFKEQIRVIKIKYTLRDGSNVLQNQEIESSVAIDKSLIRPFYIQQRKAAEASYKENIRLMIEEINEL
ncbi:hypothetical protein [Halomonas piscis]|uniref:hypothetical protein n=1 Tax=Halomonas piscis TaxID=3031727 RepID=UPI0028A0EC30|nr:hypothetical protein [Halomonas piscis]